jgi:hypothetical protein
MPELPQTPPSSPGPPTTENLPTLVTELWEMVVGYAKQETVEPVKGLGRFLGFGLAGAVLTSFGLVLLALAGLRVVQVETTLHGHLSWLPYLIVVAVAGAIAGLAVRAITKPRRAKEG